MASAIVTGGAGFIGSHLVDHLLGEGYRVVAVDDLSNGLSSRVSDQAELVELDVLEYEPLLELVRSTKPEAVFHLAAQSVVTVSVADPWFDFRVNAGGTLNVIQAAKEVAAPVVFASTGGALYGDGVPIPTPETQPPAPKAPYGASKWAAEAYLRTWTAAGGLPNAICRLGNVYGPRQNPHGEAGVVAIISHKLWSGERATLYGHGKATRDYVHVADVAGAMLRAVGVEGVFNISAGREVTVLEVFELLRKEAGVEAEPELAALREGELERSGLDPSAAAEELGWRAEIPLDRGLGDTYRALVAEFEDAQGSK